MQKKYLGKYVINGKTDLKGSKAYIILTLVDCCIFLKLQRDTLNSTIDKNRI